MLSPVNVNELHKLDRTGGKLTHTPCEIYRETSRNTNGFIPKRRAPSCKKGAVLAFAAARNVSSWLQHSFCGTESNRHRFYRNCGMLHQSTGGHSGHRAESSAVSAVLWSAWGTQLPRTCRCRTGLLQPGEWSAWLPQGQLSRPHIDADREVQDLNESREK